MFVPDYSTMDACPKSRHGSENDSARKGLPRAGAVQREALSSVWKIKVLIQFVLSHIPWGERVNHLLQRLNTRRKGGNRLESEQRLPDLCASLKLLRQYTPLQDAVVVEVGTGWCPIPTMLLSLCGTRRVYTYDHVRHVRFDLTREMLAVIEEHLDEIADNAGESGERVAQRLAEFKNCTDLDELCRSANIRIHRPG